MSFFEVINVINRPILPVFRELESGDVIIGPSDRGLREVEIIDGDTFTINGVICDRNQGGQSSV